MHHFIFSYLIARVFQIHQSRHQRNKLKLDEVPKPAEWQRLRHQHSVASMGTAEAMPAVPNLVIRRPSVVQTTGNVIGLAALKGIRKNRSVGRLTMYL